MSTWPDWLFWTATLGVVAIGFALGYHVGRYVL